MNYLVFFHTGIPGTNGNLREEWNSEYLCDLAELFIQQEYPLNQRWQDWTWVPE